MNAAKWILIGLYVFSAIFTVSQVGKPRNPITPGSAAASLIITGGLIGLVLAA